MNWASVVLYRLNEEIQTRKAQSTLVICLFSAFYISCLCEGKREDLTPPQPTSPMQPKSPDSPSLVELEVQLGHIKNKMREVEMQLSEKKDKLVEVHERSAGYLQQFNQLL